MMALSLVTSIGNDDYGSRIYRDVEPAVPTPEKKRTQFCLFTLREAFKNIDYELIIVEWLGTPGGEPPSEWEFLKDERTHIITVPYEFTQRICPERPFHETHAKNIGVRRARGEMILTMNNDCLWLDEFPKEVLEYKHDILVADRPTVYHTVMDCGLDYAALQKYCLHPENQVHAHDLNSNGDFTLMHRDTWFALQGLCTPAGDKLAGVDMFQVLRAEQHLRRIRLIYRHPIWHIRHAGAPLDSGYGQTVVTDNWGFLDEIFKEK